MNTTLDRLLDDDSLTLTDLLRARIARVLRSMDVLALRRLVVVAAADADDLHTFLLDVSKTYQHEHFDWRMVDDAQADKMVHALTTYREIYRSTQSMTGLARWWVAALAGLPRLHRLAQANLLLIDELLLALDEDRVDTLAAIAVLQSGGKTYTLDEVMDSLDMAA